MKDEQSAGLIEQLVTTQFVLSDFVLFSKKGVQLNTLNISLKVFSYHIGLYLTFFFFYLIVFRYSCILADDFGPHWEPVALSLLPVMNEPQ